LALAIFDNTTLRATQISRKAISGITDTNSKGWKIKHKNHIPGTLIKAFARSTSSSYEQTQKNRRIDYDGFLIQ
jgi:hypothetical protein